MPLAIDDSKMEGKVSATNPKGDQIVKLDPANPPTKQIPYAEFPRCVYQHPTKPFIVIEHRNAKQELVNEEVVPTSHATRIVKDAKELEKALKEGWVKEPYVPQAPADPNEGLYKSA